MTHEEIVKEIVNKATTALFIEGIIEKDEIEQVLSIITTALATYRTQVLEEERTRIAELIDGYKVDDGVSFEGDLPPAEIFAEMLDDTNMIR